MPVWTFYLCFDVKEVLLNSVQTLAIHFMYLYIFIENSTWWRYVQIPPFFFFCCGVATQRGSWPPHSWGFLDHTQRRTTVGRTPLDEWSACRRDLYLTAHNTHNRQISMPPVGFEPTISAGQRPQTYALDRVATGTDTNYPLKHKCYYFHHQINH